MPGPGRPRLVSDRKIKYLSGRSRFLDYPIMTGIKICNTCIRWASTIGKCKLIISLPQGASTAPIPIGANVGLEFKELINRHTHRITATYREPLAHLWAASCASLFMARHARLLASVQGGCQGVRSEVANMSFGFPRT